MKDSQMLSRLGVFLMSISNSGVKFQNGVDSSFAVEVKENKDCD